MAILVTLQGPQVGRHFLLEPDGTILGRHADAQVYLESQAVSRHHARLLCRDEIWHVEDLHSSNGTYVNGQRIETSVPLTQSDTLHVGPYVFGLRLAPDADLTADSLVIRDQINALSSSQHLPGHDPAYKLQVVLEIAQHLGRTLDLNVLLEKLLDQLMELFPQADRAMVLLCDGEALVVRCQRGRGAQDTSRQPYSRTIVKRALEEGVGLLSEDARADRRFDASTTLASLDLRSLLCVPMICQDGRRLGVLQLDRFRTGKTFQKEDLQLLTVIAIQVAVVLENASLHAELLREERLYQELALARDIQQSFLPTAFPHPDQAGYELYARLLPAREVAGDLYDFFTLADGRLAFFVGDVSGKSIPAALFMMAVRTLGRHLACSSTSPSETLTRLNDALAMDNPSGMFVTVVHGIYTPATGALIVASGGHPRPLLRSTDGAVDEVDLTPGRLLGYAPGALGLSDTHLTLQSGETLVLYTDGVTEAQAVDCKEMFGISRLRAALASAPEGHTLEHWAEDLRVAMEKFTGAKELQDDVTLLMLRRS